MFQTKKGKFWSNEKRSGPLYDFDNPIEQKKIQALSRSLGVCRSTYTQGSSGLS
jgi:hypothetical protein